MSRFRVARIQRAHEQLGAAEWGREDEDAVEVRQELEALLAETGKIGR